MDKPRSFRVYEGDDLFKLSEEKKVPIVEDMIFENDYILLVAKEKVGKSILAMQLACNISSGTPFLDVFKVPVPRRVWYFATEGKDEDMKQRLVNMAMKIKVNKHNLKLICSAGFKFNSRIGVQDLNYLLKTYSSELPKVIIIDALYMAINGSLKDDRDVNEFTYRVRQFAEACDAAVLIIHHSRRPVVYEGKSTESYSDDDIYGSAFLKASVDHCFYMGKIFGTDKKFLKCDTQRSGNIAEKIELRLNEPTPLYFEAVGIHGDYKHRVVHLLKNHPKGLTIKQMVKLSSLTRPTVYRTLEKMEEMIKKTRTRPVIYTLKEGI